MSGLTLVASLGIVGLLVALLMFKLDSQDNKHIFLQVIFISFLLGIVVLLGKASLDYNDNCGWLVSNETVEGNSTIFANNYVCNTNTNTTANTFYQWTVWIMRVTFVYMIAYFIYELLVYAGFITKKKREDDE